MNPQLPDLASADLDALCDRFEDAHRRGETPVLDHWLGRAGSLASAALPELASLDLHYRAAAGEPVAAADYFTRYPELLSDHERAVRLVAAEYRVAAARDPGVTEEGFRRRYPDLAAGQE